MARTKMQNSTRKMHIDAQTTPQNEMKQLKKKHSKVIEKDTSMLKYDNVDTPDENNVATPKFNEETEEQVSTPKFNEEIESTEEVSTPKFDEETESTEEQVSTPKFNEETESTPKFNKETEYEEEIESPSFVDEEKQSKTKKKTKKETVNKSKEEKQDMDESKSKQKESKSKVNETDKKEGKSKKQGKSKKESEKKESEKKESEKKESEKKKNKKTNKKTNKEEVKGVEEIVEDEVREKKIGLFDKDKNIEHYDVKFLRKIAGEMKIKGRSKMNKEELYNILRNTEEEEEEEEDEEFNKDNKASDYTMKKLKLIATNINLKNRSDYRKKDELYEAIKNYYESSEAENPSMAPKNLKEFTQKYTVDQYTKRQLYDFGKNSKLPVRKDMNKDKLYSILVDPQQSNEETEEPIDPNADVFSLMLNYKVDSISHIESKLLSSILPEFVSTSNVKVMSLTRGKKYLYIVLFSSKKEILTKQVSRSVFQELTK